MNAVCVREIDRAATCGSHSRVWLGTAFVQSCSNVFQEHSTQGTWPSGNLSAPTMHSFQPAGCSCARSYCREWKVNTQEVLHRGVTRLLLSHGEQSVTISSQYCLGLVSWSSLSDVLLYFRDSSTVNFFSWISASDLFLLDSFLAVVFLIRIEILD